MPNYPISPESVIASKITSTGARTFGIAAKIDAIELKTGLIDAKTSGMPGTMAANGTNWKTVVIGPRTDAIGGKTTGIVKRTTETDVKTFAIG